MTAYEISTDPARLDLDLVHGFLSGESYWAPGIPRDVVERAVAGSLSFGAYARSGEMVGYARAITDRATFAWVGDVFVVEGHRGQGLGKRLMEAMLAHPDLQGLRLWMLGTADAHGLYARYGFEQVPEGMFMRRLHDPRELYGA